MLGPFIALALALAATAPTPSKGSSKATPPPPATPVTIAVENAGFEGSTATPAGWAATGSARVSVEEGPASDGGRRLVLEAPAGGGAATVLSTPVSLEVGRLHRLSARVATRGVRADPEPRWPTALGACIAMRSFPFTNCSPAAGGDSDGRVEVLFLATSARDQVALVLGRNGNATGRVAFDDVRLERLDDVTALVPLEQVRWAGPAFRYESGGWIFVHVEGEPYPRGRQYGELVAPEMATYLEKLAILQDKGDPERGWNGLRRLADALMLRRYDPEYLEEMRGIADGAARAGAKFKGREVDLLDVVTLNSAVDLGQLDDALKVSPTHLSGRSFLSPDEETDPAATAKDRCSSFVATGPATRDGRFVMGQLFMWNGYSGVHWDVILDVVPARGHRVVMQTFPGGIHSGADWYQNGAGIVIGETTVGQTPFVPEGTPQSNRARKAAQYASSIDEVARILRERNNGLYTNDWTIADAKTDEGADLLLGTKAWKLWRTGSKGHAADTPGGLPGFVWANNNTRDAAVRAEYAVAADDAPADMAFAAWNRDVAFWNFFAEKGRGAIDLEAAVRLHASTPVNRPHACDGKITTGDMADRLVFVAHYGKTTLREKWVGGRFIADLPGAVPHFTLGYTTFSPVTMADGLRAARARRDAAGVPRADPLAPKVDAAPLGEWVTFDRKLLWKGTVRPASDGDNWLTSGSAAYHAILRKLPDEPAKAHEAIRAALGEMNLRHEWLARREGITAPAATRNAFDRYGPHAIPRARGTFALHQLRLALGNATFSKVMNGLQARFAGAPVTTAAFLALARELAGRDVASIVLPWIERVDLPAPAVTASAAPAAAGSASPVGDGFTLTVKVAQPVPWPWAASLAVKGEKGVRLEKVRMEGSEGTFVFSSRERPLRVTLDQGVEIPVARDEPYALASLLDDLDHLLWVRGTSREVEANRTLSLLWREVVGDASVEVLPRLVADAEVAATELAVHDLVVVGGPADNQVAARIARAGALPLESGPGWFRWEGRIHAAPDDGLAVAVANPWNPARAAFVYLANSKVQLWRMLKGYTRGLPSWALWKGGEVTSKGFLGATRLDVAVAEGGGAR